MPEQAPDSALLQSDTSKIQPPASGVARAQAPDYDALWAESMRDIEGYWAKTAGGLTWFKPWDTVLEWNYPHAKWFTGGRCNITVNALDRHVRSARAEKRALIWLGENGEERVFTFRKPLATGTPNQLTRARYAS